MPFRCKRDNCSSQSKASWSKPISFDVVDMADAVSPRGVGSMPKVILSGEI
jgi:hypothetical protein